jgi:uncharacterized damage-inducible protein DinB
VPDADFEPAVVTQARLLASQGEEIAMCVGLVQTHRAFAYNNAWANHRLLGACAELTQGEFEAGRTGFFPSLQATLNHIFVIDLFYVDALEGGWLGPTAWKKSNSVSSSC